MINLYRFAHFKTGTLGRLVLPNGAELYTIERPWLNNKPFVSCVPSGLYELEWDTTGRVTNVPRLRSVAERTHINIHVANWASELQGCIAPGLSWNFSENIPAVEQSSDALALLMESLDFRENEDGSDMVYAGTEHQASINIQKGIE